jgi:hypothetical protein
MKIMKDYNLIKSVLLGVLVVGFFACDETTMDSIDQNPNAPTDVTISLLLPQTTISTIHGIAGGAGARYSSKFVEHVANVHVNERQPFDVNAGVWSNIYSTLMDLSLIIEKGSEGGSQEGHFVEVGIAKILYAYTLSVGTDLFGDMPHSEALQGSSNRSPNFDTQENIYDFLQMYLDEAIVDLDRGTLGNINHFDLVFRGDIEMWKKTAFALKARLYNRLSNIDPEGSAMNSLEALANSYTSEAESFIFDGYLSGSTNDNPWTSRQKSQQGYAVSTTFLDVINEFNDPEFIDPRVEIWLTRIEGEFVGAPPGTAQSDVSHILYSPPSTQTVLYDEAPQPVLTYDELKFIEAEAHFRLGNLSDANTAYEEAVIAACRRAGLTEEQVEMYVSQGDVFPGESELALDHIILQKYISLWMFQSLEAYNDVRRTGILQVNDPRGLPLRLPYPPSEINRNSNAPTHITNVSIYEIPVWWALGGN